MDTSQAHKYHNKNLYKALHTHAAMQCSAKMTLSKQSQFSLSISNENININKTVISAE